MFGVVLTAACCLLCAVVVLRGVACCLLFASVCYCRSLCAVRCLPLFGT